jgi:hypothetical protein
VVKKQNERATMAEQWKLDSKKNNTEGEITVKNQTF